MRLPDRRARRCRRRVRAEIHRRVLQRARPDDVVAAINSWAFGNSAQVALAASALAYGLEDDRTRRWFHRQCYRWASARTLRPQIAELVIAACVGNIAPNHPGEAVVRLHQLCRNHDSRVVESAGSALFSLADDRRALRRLLARLTTFPHGRLDHHEIDRDLFLAVARPTALAVGGDDTEALIADPGVRDDLVMGWRSNPRPASPDRIRGVRLRVVRCAHRRPGVSLPRRAHRGVRWCILARRDPAPHGQEVVQPKA